MHSYTNCSNLAVEYGNKMEWYCRLLHLLGKVLDLVWAGRLGRRLSGNVLGKVDGSLGGVVVPELVQLTLLVAANERNTTVLLGKGILDGLEAVSLGLGGHDAGVLEPVVRGHYGKQGLAYVMSVPWQRQDAGSSRLTLLEQVDDLPKVTEESSVLL